MMFRNRNLRNFEVPPDFSKFDNRGLSARSKNALSPVYNFDEYALPYKLDQVTRNLTSKKSDELSLGSTNDSDILNFISDHDGSLDKSCSSSSLSWADDYEDGLTKKVDSELKRMDKVLQRLEHVPSNYDNDEYELWIRTFPISRLLGQEKHHTKRPQKFATKSTETLPSSSGSSTCLITKAFTCDKRSTSRDKLQSAVISESPEDGTYHFAEQKESTIRRRKQSRFKPEKREDKTDRLHYDHETKIFHNSSLDSQFETLLRISRAPVAETPPRILESRRSSNQVARSQVSASKWLRSDSPEFSSMPYLIVEQCSPRPSREMSAISAKGKPRYEIKRRQPSLKRHPKLSPRSSFVTLPPILQNTGGQFRSISATPRQHSKSSSALSVSSLLGGRKRFDIENSAYIDGTKQSLIPRLQNGSFRKV